MKTSRSFSDDHSVALEKTQNVLVFQFRWSYLQTQPNWHKPVAVLAISAVSSNIFFQLHETTKWNNKTNCMGISRACHLSRKSSNSVEMFGENHWNDKKYKKRSNLAHSSFQK